MKKEMKLIIIVNDGGRWSFTAQVNNELSYSHVAIVTWATCLLYLRFPICRMEVVRVGNLPGGIIGELNN